MSIPVTGDAFYRPGPCAPYPFATFCAIPIEAAAVSGTALQAASEIAFYATAQRFDACQVTLRPCKRECYGSTIFGTGWWWDGSWPRPLNIDGQWYNMTCGVCAGNCSCTIISETVLPGPVREVVQVTVDGVILTPDVDYRLDDYRRLVRIDAFWPFCNDLNKDISQPGTWSVTAIYGEPLPALGRLAVGELFCQILASLLGNECQLPPNVTSLTRQGVSMDLETTQEALAAGFDGLRYVDKFIQQYNPSHLRARAYAFDLDSPDFRVTGTRIQ